MNISYCPGVGVRGACRQVAVFGFRPSAAPRPRSENRRRRPPKYPGATSRHCTGDHGFHRCSRRARLGCLAPGIPGSFLAFCYCFLAGSVFPLGSGSSAGCYPFGKENLMPSIDIATPASSAPTDRLALGVGWVRPGVAGIGGTLTPSGPYNGCYQCVCFEGNEE